MSNGYIKVPPVTASGAGTVAATNPVMNAETWGECLVAVQQIEKREGESLRASIFGKLLRTVASLNDDRPTSERRDTYESVALWLHALATYDGFLPASRPKTAFTE